MDTISNSGSNRVRNRTQALRGIVAWAFVAIQMVLGPWVVAGPAADDLWQRTLSAIRETFPAVPQMTTQQLATALERGAPVLLLDARTADEFRTSHLGRATRAPTVGTALNSINAARRQSIVVVYCSVGYRSSRLVSRLQARGVKNVFNLEGSLFRWANEGRPLVRGSETVTTVHPYDDEWGALLEESVRAD